MVYFQNIYMSKKQKRVVEQKMDYKEFLKNLTSSVREWWFYTLTNEMLLQIFRAN